jgi:twitching motility protein PilT
VFWQQGYIGAVLRVIPLVIRNFEQLNLPACLDDICLARRGLILVTGATGNGKSTTLAAMLQRINQTRRSHIVTIEDPIEYLFPNEKSLVIQREVGSDTGTFRSALVAALRQDPDVIMIGEVRDYETAEICLKGAETGHLVMTAIHTPDAVRTIQRFMGLFPPEDHESARVRLAESLKATVSLRLLPAVEPQPVRPFHHELRRRRVCPGRHDQVVLQFPVHAVINQVDSRIDAAVPNPAILRNVHAPVSRVGSREVITPAGKECFAFHRCVRRTPSAR